VNGGKKEEENLRKNGGIVVYKRPK